MIKLVDILQEIKVRPNLGINFDDVKLYKCRLKESPAEIFYLFSLGNYYAKYYAEKIVLYHKNMITKAEYVSTPSPDDNRYVRGMKKFYQEGKYTIVK